MIEICDLLKSMKSEKDALIRLKTNLNNANWGIVNEFNWRRLHREMNKLCSQHVELKEQLIAIEEKLTELEADPPRYFSFVILVSIFKKKLTSILFSVLSIYRYEIGRF